MPLTKIQSLGITDGAIVAADIASGAITAAKLASGVGGKVLQVITATDSTERSSTSSTWVTASNTLSVSITPSSASNKIFIICSTQLVCNGDNDVNGTIYRNSTNLGNATYGMSRAYGWGSQANPNFNALSYLDSPNTTSATTYQFYFKSSGGYFNYNNTVASIICMEIAG
jgi:hypothetical protein